MILADSSVWISHLKRADERLGALLAARRISCHEFVQGELACGNLPQRSAFLAFLGRLPRVPAVSHQEALALLHSRRIAGQGLGWVDVHLLAATVVSNAKLWSLDRRLATAADALGVSFDADSVR